MSQPSAEARALLVNTRRAAELLCLSPRMVWTLSNRREIPSVRIGRCLRFDPEDLRRWVESRKVRQR
jgi:excisionase family DNA binding protein